METPRDDNGVFQIIKSDPTQTRKEIDAQIEKESDEDWAAWDEGGWAIAGAEDFPVFTDHDCRTKVILRASPLMEASLRFWLVAAACFAISIQGLPAQEEERFLMFPKDKPVMEGQLPEGFKGAFRKDGTYLAVGPKSVMALVALDKKVKDAGAAKSALPEFAKSFLPALSFRDLSTPTVDDAKLDRMFDDKEAAVVAKTLAATGKNSDGDEMFVSATAFPWAHRYYVLFAVCKPAGKEQLEKDQRSVLQSIAEINDD
jgi:hypothetical protein